MVYHALHGHVTSGLTDTGADCPQHGGLDGVPVAGRVDNVRLMLHKVVHGFLHCCGVGLSAGDDLEVGLVQHLEKPLLARAGRGACEVMRLSLRPGVSVLQDAHHAAGQSQRLHVVTGCCINSAIGSPRLDRCIFKDGRDFGVRLLREQLQLLLQFLQMAARRLVYLSLPPVCPGQYSILSAAQTRHEALYHVQHYPPIEVVQRRIQRFG